MKSGSARPSDHSPATQPKPAHDPWSISTDAFPTEPTATAEDKLWFALNYAILAPSSHNSQPWRFRIHGVEVDVLADPARALPIVDPEQRELIMSCGAALLHLRIALQYFGYAPRLEYFPEPSCPELLARVHMGAKAETDSDTIILFQAIQQRHTNRLAFREDPIPAELLTELENSAASEGAWFHVVTDTAARAAVADLIGQADRQQWADKHFRQELAAWIRPQNVSSLDGLPISSQDLGTLMGQFGSSVIRTFDLGKGRAAKDQDIAIHSPVLAVLGTDSDDPEAWLAAGQGLARLLLRAQAEDVAASFLNQPIEVLELRPRLAETIGRPGFPQLLLRMGYGQPVAATPRRPVASVLISRAAPGSQS